MERPRPVGRPRLGGAGRPEQLYKLGSETVDKKLAVLAYLDTKGMAVTITEFYSGMCGAARKSKRTTILRWRRERAKLVSAAASGKGGHAKVRAQGVGTVLSSELETDIVIWVNDLRSEGIPVSTLMLTEKTQLLAADAEIQDFRASDKWVVGFKRRHRFSLRVPTRQAQVSPADINAVAAAFGAKVEATMRDLGVRRVYNADQTAVFFEYVAKKTLHARGEKTIWVKCSGASIERATLMLLGDSDGVRHTPFVVFKAPHAKAAAAQAESAASRRGFGPYVWRDICKIKGSTEMEIYGNPKGWRNGDLSVAFLRYHFASRPSPQEPILLLWDDFSGHWTDSVVRYAATIHVVLMKVPPHATPVSQPADVAWNFPLKSHLRKLWHSDMHTQIAAPREPCTSFKLARPNRAKICSWIDCAWKHLPSTAISNGFRASGLLPGESCVAAAELVTQLETLSLLEGRSVDVSQDFANEADAEEE